MFLVHRLPFGYLITCLIYTCVSILRRYGMCLFVFLWAKLALVTCRDSAGVLLFYFIFYTANYIAFQKYPFQKLERHGYLI